jgi:hypothetical protein
MEDLIKLGGQNLLYHYHFSFPKLLSLSYPEHNWDIPQKSKFHKKSQYVLKAMLKTMFPKEAVLEEYKHPDLLVSTGYPLELDFFYPQINVAIEYQVQ